MSSSTDTPQLALARDATGRARLLHDLTHALGRATTSQEIARSVFQHGLRVPGVTAGTVCLSVGPDALGMVYVHGGPEGVVDTYAAFPLAAPLPACQAVREKAAVWIASLEDLDGRFPAMSEAARQVGHQAWALLPLLDRHGEAFGALGVACDQPYEFTPVERAFLHVVAEQAAMTFDRVRLYEAERAARLEAEAQRANSQSILAILASDLRTPLSAILSSGQLLTRSSDLAPPDRDRAARIVRSAERAGAILRDLLDYSRKQSGLPVVISQRPIALDAVLHATVSELACEGATPPFVLRCAGTIHMRGDPDRLQQLASNLLDNARRYGGGAPVEVGLEIAGGEVVLSVHNAGPPIEAAALERIFEPFQSGRQGLGLGLFIVHQIAVAHGGRVEVTSTAGAGTTFRVYLPRSVGPSTTPGGS